LLPQQLPLPYLPLPLLQLRLLPSLRHLLLLEQLLQHLLLPLFAQNSVSLLPRPLQPYPLLLYPLLPLRLHRLLP
jgi:hypothetical protein